MWSRCRCCYHNCRQCLQSCKCCPRWWSYKMLSKLLSPCILIMLRAWCPVSFFSLRWGLDALWAFAFYVEGLMPCECIYALMLRAWYPNWNHMHISCQVDEVVVAYVVDIKLSSWWSCRCISCRCWVVKLMKLSLHKLSMLSCRCCCRVVKLPIYLMSWLMSNYAKHLCFIIVV